MTTETASGFVVPMEVPDDTVRDLLVSAFEGGSNYWMEVRKVELPEGVTKEDVREGGKYCPKDYYHPWYAVPFLPGGALLIGDIEDESGATYRLDRGSIAAGLRAMAVKCLRYWADVLTENADADTADVFLQCCLFGEIVYS